MFRVVVSGQNNELRRLLFAHTYIHTNHLPLYDYFLQVHFPPS